MNVKKNIVFLSLLFSLIVPIKTMQHTPYQDTSAQESKQDTSHENNNNNLEDFFADNNSEEMPIPEIKKLNWLEKYLCTIAIKIALTYGFLRDSIQGWYTSLRIKK